MILVAGGNDIYDRRAQTTLLKLLYNCQLLIRYIQDISGISTKIHVTFCKKNILILQYYNYLFLISNIIVNQYNSRNPTITKNPILD